MLHRISLVGAACHGFVDVVQLLLDRGADVTDEIALRIACREGHLDEKI